jgi:hypothetical protein
MANFPAKQSRRNGDFCSLIAWVVNKQIENKAMRQGK